jgi:hypothetical protein
MNFCTRCGSHYERPGTCNCFAGAQPLVPAPHPAYVPVPHPCPWWEVPGTAPYFPIYPVGPTWISSSGVASPQFTFTAGPGASARTGLPEFGSGLGGTMGSGN